MTYLQEHSYTIPKVFALLKKNNKHFIVDGELPHVSANTEYVAAPHQLIQNYLFHQHNLKTTFNGMSRINFYKLGDKVCCNMWFNFSDTDLKSETAYETIFAKRDLPPYSVMSYDAPIYESYMQISAGGIFRNKKNEILLLAKDIDGKIAWDLPGGMQDAGELPKDTAAREFYEEITYNVPKADMKLAVIDFTNGLTEQGLLGVRMVYNIDGAYELDDFNIKNNPDEKEQFCDIAFFPVKTIVDSDMLPAAQRKRIKTAISVGSAKPCYSVWANVKELQLQHKGKYL
ncbi:MAG: NUDIX hydrolase [Rickettsiales bacterium]|jgi:8-oxo-dGTP pyrophosphatase MutT (NUDIX family)|nr:NUDIX hydrolase [Rickettsiales bacterium]